MGSECNLLNAYGFFRKYQVSKDMVCKGFIALYCKGAQMNECKRLEYRNKNGVPPVDEMMPSGQLIKI